MTQLMDSDNDIVNKLRMDVVRLESKLDLSEKALVYSRELLEKRLEHMNEFRQALSDQAAKFVTRSELWSVFISVVMVTVAIVTLMMKVFNKGA